MTEQEYSTESALAYLRTSKEGRRRLTEIAAEACTVSIAERIAQPVVGAILRDVFNSPEFRQELREAVVSQIAQKAGLEVAEFIRALLYREYQD